MTSASWNLKIGAGAFFAFCIFLLPLAARAALINADGLLGQPDYTTETSSSTIPNASGFNAPTGIALDTVYHRMFVTDANNNRVLVFNLNTDNTLASTTASYVLGQSTFTSNTAATTQNGLNYPRGLAYDASNTILYVTDRLNSRVMVFNVNPATITNGENAINVLGQSDFTTSTGAVTQSRIGTDGPRNGIIFDAANNRLFVVDGAGKRVLVYDVTNAATPNALNGENASYVIGQRNFTSSVGAISQSGLNAPIGLGYDPVGLRLFVADYGNMHVLVFNVATSTIANGENASYVLGGNSFMFRGFRTFDAAGMFEPDNMSYDTTSHLLFMPDEIYDRVLVFNVATSTITNGENASYVLGQNDFSSVSPAAGQNGLAFVHASAYNPANQQLFVADYDNNRVVVFDGNPSTISSGENAIGEVGELDMNGNAVYGQTGVNNSGTNALNFSAPGYMAVDTEGHRLFVSDFNNSRVLVFALNNDNTLSTTTPSYVLGQNDFTSTMGTTTQSGLLQPTGLAYSSSQQLLYVSDSGNSRVLVFDVATSTIANGENASYVLGQSDFTSQATPLTQQNLLHPQGLAYDSASDRLFVGDDGNSRVLIFDVATSTIANGENASHVLGQSDFMSNTQQVTENGLSSTAGLAYNLADGLLYVSDSADNRVLVFDAATSTLFDGEDASYVLGQSGFTSSAAATTQSSLSNPMGLSYDDVDNALYVSDEANNRILAFDVATSTIANGENASNVIGQSDFISSTDYATTQDSILSPEGVLSIPSDGLLYVADTGNDNRVLQIPL